MNGIQKPYLFAPKFSFTPSKICLYNEVSVRKANTNEYYNAMHLKSLESKKTKESKKLKNLVRNYHNFQISKNAYRTLKKKIDWLYFLAKSRYIVTHSGKKIYNFKMLFLTLTLPSKQVHTTSFITSNFFNQFITEMRKITGMTNYVWRLEHQQNGNVHYHIVTDTYIDYLTARRVWNRILDKKDYVKKYSEKFIKMSLREYYDYVITNQKKYNNNFADNDYFSFKSVAKRFAKLKKEGFSQPNSVDVKSVTSSKKVSSYIAKYFGKHDSEQNNCNVLDDEENSRNLRLWFCSRSLSKLKSIVEYIDHVNFSPNQIIKNVKAVKKKFYKYCTVIYYDFKELSNSTKNIFSRLLKRYANSCEYLPAT